MTLKDRLAFFESLKETVAPLPINKKGSIATEPSQLSRAATEKSSTSPSISRTTTVNKKETTEQPADLSNEPRRVSVLKQAFDHVAKMNGYVPPNSVKARAASFDQRTQTETNNKPGIQTFVNSNGTKRVLSREPSVSTPVSAPIMSVTSPVALTLKKLSLDQGTAKPAPKPTATHSSIVKRLSLTNPSCHVCSKPVYFMEQLTIDNHHLHKTCLKCEHCKMTLKLGNYAAIEGKYYCKPHFTQLFKLKGNYHEGFQSEDTKKVTTNA